MSDTLTRRRAQLDLLNQYITDDLRCMSMQIGTNARLPIDENEHIRLLNVEEQLSQMKQSFSKFICVVCREHQIEYALDCGHVLCSICLPQVRAVCNSCPMCRTPWARDIKLFI